MKYIGPHLSIAGGLFRAADQALEIGATGFALFTKNQRQWRAPDVTADESRLFREHCSTAGIAADAILPHDSYLINLGNPDEEKRAAAAAAFTAEMQRVEALGLKLLNFHPGSALGTPVPETLQRIAQGIRQALSETTNVVAVIENTAGQGTVVGKNLDELCALLELVNEPARCGICIDTCHAYAAGIDIASPDGLDLFWEQFDKRIGFSLLRGMHLNDTCSKLGSHLDRHAPLGAGLLGWDLFLKIAADPRLDGKPLILETTDPARWPDETKRLLAASR